MGKRKIKKVEEKKLLYLQKLLVFSVQRVAIIRTLILIEIFCNFENDFFGVLTMEYRNF